MIRRGSRLYQIWTSMRNRCNNPNCRVYHRYGGRGISICHEWSRFATFESWALSSGYSHTLTIDRIDNDGNYEPSNCQWLTGSENAAKAMYDKKRRGDCKLNIAQVTQIKKRLLAGETCAAIAPDFGVARETINDIALCKLWSDIEPILPGVNRKNSLTMEVAIEIKNLLLTGMKVQSVAETVGCSKHAVTAINIGRSWWTLLGPDEIDYPIVKDTRYDYKNGVRYSKKQSPLSNTQVA